MHFVRKLNEWYYGWRWFVQCIKTWSKSNTEQNKSFFVCQISFYTCVKMCETNKYIMRWYLLFTKHPMLFVICFDFSTPSVLSIYIVYLFSIKKKLVFLFLYQNTINSFPLINRWNVGRFQNNLNITNRVSFAAYAIIPFIFVHSLLKRALGLS